MPANGVLRQRRPNGHGPAKEMLGVEKTEQQIGIGDRRRFASQTIARRSGLGPGTLWPDA